MSANSRLSVGGVILALIVGSFAAPAHGQKASTDTFRISKRMSDAILADFKEVDSSQFAPPVEMPPAPAIAADDGLTLEVDPDVVELPAVMVQERNPSESLTRELVTVPPGPGFGTGITEYRGKKFSLLTKRILFIPVAFKLAW